MPTSHFLDTLPFDFARPEADELWRLLRGAINDKKLVRQLLSKAKVEADLVDFDQPIRHLWHDVLEQARNQDRLKELLDTIENEPACSAVSKRIHELRGPAPAIERELPGRKELEKSGWHEKVEERITGAKTTLRGISFLARGMTCSRSVVRLRAWFPSSGESIGTGFLIAKDIVLTNHHVLFSPDGGTFEKASNVEVWLGYENEADGRLLQHTIVRGVADSITGNREDDWAVVQLATPVSEDVPVLSLDVKNPVNPGDPVYIIQHPRGEPKQISLGHNEVRYTDDRVIQYLTDTDAGSSGSPVFNERWEVVGLHHLWTDADTADGKTEIRNEGIRIERVAAALRANHIIG